MRSRIITVAVLVVFLAAGVFGVIKRQTYTDTASENNYMDRLNVALLPEKNVISCCNALAEELPNVPIILKVKCMDEMEYVFGAGQQKVHVEEIFKGSELVGEEELYVYSERWGLSLTVAPVSAELGFVNVMEPGEEYLVFLSGKKVRIPGKDTRGYEMFSDMLLLPVFLYGDDPVADPAQQGPIQKGDALAVSAAGLLSAELRSGRSFGPDSEDGLNRSPRTE